MKRKLLVLDIALVAALVWAGVQIRSESRAAQARQAAKLNRPIKPVAPPQFSPLPTPPAVLASGYAQIAQKMLFDRSRNPTVIVEVPPPPPPKPMPPLPVYHGMMNLGDGPVAVMSATSNSPHQEVRPGEAIGPFKLLAVDNQDISLEWDGKVINKKVDEMLDRTVAQAAPQRTVEAPAPAPPPVPKSATGPGSDTGRGFKMCNPNDNMPSGAVVDGYIKSITPTPFGVGCRWDPVGR